MALAADPSNPYNFATGSFADFASAYGPSSGMPTAGGTAAAGPSAADVPMVYVGNKKVNTPMVGTFDFTPREFDQHKSKSKVPHIVPVTKALSKFDRMDAEEQHNMLRLLLIGGFGGSVDLADIDDVVTSASLDDAREAYKQLLITANDYYQNSGLMVTPDDVLRSAMSYRLGGEGAKWNGKFSEFDNGIAEYAKNLASSGDLSGTLTQTYKSVDFMDPADARNLTRGMLQQELGRDPTQAEYEDFLSALHAAEKANPSITKTTQTTDSQGRVIDQNTVTHQGIGAGGLAQRAQDKAQAAPSWAEWQAMGTYAPALFQALGSAVPGV